MQVHVHIKRFLMKELLETDEVIAQWCRDLFVEKVSIIHLVLQQGAVLGGLACMFEIILYLKRKRRIVVTLTKLCTFVFLCLIMFILMHA